MTITILLTCIWIHKVAAMVNCQMKVVGLYIVVSSPLIRYYGTSSWDVVLYNGHQSSSVSCWHVEQHRLRWFSHVHNSENPPL